MQKPLHLPACAQTPECAAIKVGVSVVWRSLGPEPDEFPVARSSIVEAMGSGPFKVTKTAAGYARIKNGSAHERDVPTRWLQPKET